MGHKKKIKLGADGSVHIESEHFDVGGAVGSGVNTISQPGLNAATTVAAPVGQAAQGIASDFTAQNGFQAKAPDISNQEGIYNQANQGQDALAQALTNQANGQGPNPALAQLKQTTNANANQAAGLVASQRGLNPGEAARLGSQAQVTANQTAGGQAATTAAQQQLAAESGLESVYGQQENAASQNANVVGGQNLTAQGLNQSTQQANTNAVNTTTGGLLNGIGGALGLAKGGKVENPKLSTVPGKDRFKGNIMPSHLKAVSDIYHGNKFADGGTAISGENFGAIAAPPPLLQSDYVQAAKTAPGKAPRPAGGDSADEAEAAPAAATPEASPDLGNLGSLQGTSFGASTAGWQKGGNVPGKPKVGHDAYKNDTVSAKLTPGEVVIDLDTMKDKGPIGDAARMLAQHIQEKNGEGGDHEDDFKEALNRAVAGRKSK